MVLIVALICAAIFYLCIPVCGGLVTRRRWLRFRRAVSSSLLWPLIDEQNIGRLRNDRIDNNRIDSDRINKDGTGVRIQELGNYCFFGALEALQGNNSVWISNGVYTIVAHLHNQPLFMFDRDASTYAYRPKRTPLLANWRQVTSLPEGTQVFIAGPLYAVQGQLQFYSAERHEPLLVVLYEGTHNELHKRLIWHGRQRNEFWNLLTLPSLCAGMFVLGILTFITLRLYGSPQLVTLIIIVMALSPLLVLMPPGAIGFFLYRRLWGAGWLVRAKCDILHLIEHAECQRWRALLFEIGAGLFLLAGLLINGYLTLLLLSRLIF